MSVAHQHDALHRHPTADILDTRSSSHDGQHREKVSWLKVSVSIVTAIIDRDVFISQQSNLTDVPEVVCSKSHARTHAQTHTPREKGTLLPTTPFMGADLQE